MNAHSFRKPLQRHNLIQLAIVLLTSLVVVYGFASGIAQSQKEDATAASDNERKFENIVPEHVPVKIKLKNEQSFKKKENKNWDRRQSGGFVLKKD